MTEMPVIRVVVIDDHEMFLQSVVRLLQDDPQIIVVGTALTAVEGIEITEREQPDIVIFDYNLPDMDGPQAIRALRHAMPTGKVITLTGVVRPGALYASMRAGSSAWVRKTRAIQELRLSVKQVAAGRTISSDELDVLPTLDQLDVHYQPVVSLATGRIAGFEALVRWHHPQRGLLFPSAFLPLAEETGFVSEIDRWVRNRAVHQLADWQRRFPAAPPIWMSVNLSANDLADADLFDSFAQLVVESGINPKDLVVEVTESVLLDDTTETLEFLRQLKGLGVGLALDDFGTAFSSLSYLRQFPFDHLKLNISFTAELPQSTRCMLLVEEIFHISTSMKMMGIAEGIERRDQAEALRKIGWQFGQGYLFSRPVIDTECEALLATQT